MILKKNQSTNNEVPAFSHNIIIQFKDDHNCLDHINYRTPPKLNQEERYCYSRQHHFKNLLSNIQNINCLPNKVYDQILAELSYQKINPRELNMRSYYEYIPGLLYKLKGKQINFDHETEKQLESMFHQMQEQFEKSQSNKIINCLSYDYILHKLCQILELDPQMNHSKKVFKLKTHDEIWEKICYQLNWPFYPSL
jgi:Poxvirus Late Transcription Factor VLTF3 like